ncbi:MAG: bifunctional DNA-formamidopyrimidine glycosylase/DNA-(apurinic or apyrimidinic site) lyase [Alphaproteobacteria bacterium]|nr:bifunctional DNA-formamidopyrimidine glycosylase/DNA-(apurinic or apyrimidinic site) lyase [Alphaproteobacteria bacterium]
MPELPEVETVRRGLAPAMEGRRILRAETRRADLRFPFPPNFADRLTGVRLAALGRRAKYLVGELSTGEALVMHLGMTGRFTITDTRPGKFHHETRIDPAHDHVVFDMEGGARITFNDPRRFGSMDLWPLGELDIYPAFEGLGPEPVSNAFSAAYLREAFAGKKTPVKAALLDQRVVAGLGNIYVSEALFRAGISPRRLAGSIRPERLERLAAEVRAVIDEAILAGGSSISDFANTDGELGYFQHRFRVYDREGEACPVCERPIRRLVQSGRSTFYCTRCQR